MQNFRKRRPFQKCAQSAGLNVLKIFCESRIYVKQHFLMAHFRYWTRFSVIPLQFCFFPNYHIINSFRFYLVSVAIQCHIFPGNLYKPSCLEISIVLKILLHDAISFLHKHSINIFSFLTSTKKFYLCIFALRWRLLNHFSVFPLIENQL